MRYPKGHRLHQACPQDWRRTPDMTGSFELDASIIKCKNPDVKDRLEMYLDEEDSVYGPLTGYSGYHGYSGDN